MRKELIVLIAVVALVGCANPINRKTAMNYTNAAYDAVQAGDWFKARMYFGRALINAKLGGATPKGLAILNYEYGRTSGVICDWVEAERGLNEAYKLDQETGGPTYMSLYELGRMSFAREQYDKALEYYGRAWQEFEKVQADTKDPLGYAVYLEEYAVILEKTGNKVEAEKHKARADELRSVFPGKESHTEKTPYGTRCNEIEGKSSGSDLKI